MSYDTAIVKRRRIISPAESAFAVQVSEEALVITDIGGTPLIPIGFNPILQSAIAALSTQDLANEAHISVGQVITDDGASHTIDTSGSSSLQWRTASVTFADSTSRFIVGLAAVDTANGPPARAVNVADVITFDVSKTHIGGGGTVTANAWQTNVPDAGTLTIANGDYLAFCTQMTVRGATDTIQTAATSHSNTQPSRPAVTDFAGGSYSVQTRLPNFIIVFSDGHLGWFAGSAAFTTWTQQSINNAGTNEYGNYLQLPFPTKIYGMYVNTAVAAGADYDLVLYSDPFGSPVPERTVSIDSNTTAAATIRQTWVIFSSPYTTTAGQPLAAIVKPTTATALTMPIKQMNAAAHQVTDSLGTNGYAINRSGGTGAFNVQNTNKDRACVGFLCGAFAA